MPLERTLERELDRLGDGHRDVLVLKELEGFSYREIAEVLGADAVIEVRFETSQVMGAAAELLCYGTAVVTEKA